MPKTRRTPGGQRSVGDQRVDSKNPGGTRGSDPAPITKLENQTEAQSPAARKKTGSTGAESMSELDAGRIPDEEPVNTSANTIKSREMDEED